MFLQLAARVGGRYGSEGSAGWGVRVFPQLSRAQREGGRATSPSAGSGRGESPSSGPHLHPGSGFRSSQFSSAKRPLLEFRERRDYTSTTLCTGIGGVVVLRPASAPWVPELTAAQLVAKEGAGARRGGGGHLAVPSLVSELAPALLNAQPGALSDAGQQVRFPLAQLLLAAVQRQVGAAQFLRNPKGGDAQPPVRHGRPYRTSLTGLPNPKFFPQIRSPALGSPPLPTSLLSLKFLRPGTSFVPYPVRPRCPHTYIQFPWAPQGNSASRAAQSAHKRDSPRSAALSMAPAWIPPAPATPLLPSQPRGPPDQRSVPQHYVVPRPLPHCRQHKKKASSGRGSQQPPVACREQCEEVEEIA